MSFLVSSRAQLRHVLAAPRSSPTCLPLRQTAFRRQSVKSLAAARQEVGTSTRNSVPPVAGHASAAVTVAAVAAFVGGCLACGDAGAAGLIAQPLTDLAFSAKDAKMTEDVLRPLFALFTVLYVVRIPMTWYPTIDGAQMPWALVYFPTEPVLKVARQVRAARRRVLCSTRAKQWPVDGAPAI